MVAKEIQDALYLAIHNLVDDWVLYLWALFHTTSHQEIMQKYVGGDIY